MAINRCYYRGLRRFVRMTVKILSYIYGFNIVVIYAVCGIDCNRGVLLSSELRRTDGHIIDIKEWPREFAAISCMQRNEDHCLKTITKRLAPKEHSNMIRAKRLAPKEHSNKIRAKRLVPKERSNKIRAKRLAPKDHGYKIVAK